MPLIKYLNLPIERNPAHLDIVAKANRVIRQDGYDLPDDPTPDDIETDVNPDEEGGGE